MLNNSVAHQFATWAKQRFKTTPHADEPVTPVHGFRVCQDRPWPSPSHRMFWAISPFLRLCASLPFSSSLEG